MRKERREVYLQYQRQVHKLMTDITHLSIIAQLKTTAWQTSAVVAIPMIGSVIDFALEDRQRNNTLTLALREIVILARATRPMVPPIVAAVHGRDNQLRNQALVDVGRLNDSIAGYLTAIAELRLVGRPGTVRASEVINSLLQELFGDIPVKDNRPLVERLILRRASGKSGDLDKFNHCLNALGRATAQFMSEVRADRLDRVHAWQIWRKKPSLIISAKELLSDRSNEQAAAIASPSPESSGT